MFDILLPDDLDVHGLSTTYDEIGDSGIRRLVFSKKLMSDRVSGFDKSTPVELLKTISCYDMNFPGFRLFHMARTVVVYYDDFQVVIKDEEKEVPYIIIEER